MLQELIDRYEKNRHFYLSSAYTEAQLRSDFLDPLIEALGWDIHNSLGKSTREREMLVEESLSDEGDEGIKSQTILFVYIHKGLSSLKQRSLP